MSLFVARDVLVNIVYVLQFFLYPLNWTRGFLYALIDETTLHEHAHLN
jgi:hypothetical protein